MIYLNKLSKSFLEIRVYFRVHAINMSVIVTYICICKSFKHQLEQRVCMDVCAYIHRYVNCYSVIIIQLLLG